MVFTEDLTVFFNPAEFASFAVINGKKVAGLFSYGYVVVNNVETHKPLFTCAHAEVADITQDAQIKVQQHVYRVLSAKPEGTGITTLVLELATKPHKKHKAKTERFIISTRVAT